MQTNGIIPARELSDLFFNSVHEHYEALRGAALKDGLPRRDSWREAILQDATEFVLSYPNCCDGVTAEELADDFMARL